MREVAGRRQSRFAECPAKRAKGDAIVSYGGLRKDVTGVREVSERLLKRCPRGSTTCRMSIELDDAFDFLRWRLICRFGALELFESLPNPLAKIVTSQAPWLQSPYRQRKLGGGEYDVTSASHSF